MKFLLEWTIVFIVIYLFYLLFVILRKKKLEKFSENTYIKYLVKLYKLDLKKHDIKKLAHIVSLTNSFVVSTTFIIVINIKNYFLMILLAIVVLIPLQLLAYHVIGKILKKGECKNV